MTEPKRDKIRGKKGNPDMRVLFVNNSPQSKRAIEFMESLGAAFRIEDITGYKTAGEKLPCLYLATNGDRFQGLEQIKRFYRVWSRLGPTEVEIED